MGGRLRAKCQPQAQAKQGTTVLGGGLCPVFLPSGTALLNQPATKFILESDHLQKPDMDAPSYGKPRPRGRGDRESF